MNADVMGTSLSMGMIYDSKGRYAQNTSIGGNVMQSTVILKDSGKISAQGQTIELSGEQLEEAKVNSYLIPEAWIGELEYSVSLDGLKDVDGTPAYKVIIESIRCQTDQLLRSINRIENQK